MKLFPTPEDEAANQILLDKVNLQQEASSTGQDTGREPDINDQQAKNHYYHKQQLLLTMWRCRALLKSIGSTSSSNLRRTSCGLKRRRWIGWTETDLHKNSKTARRAKSCWARWSSANRLFAPNRRQDHDLLSNITILCFVILYRFSFFKISSQKI